MSKEEFRLWELASVSASFVSPTALLVLLITFIRRTTQL